MTSSQYVLFLTLLYSVLVVFLNLVISYNIILTNPSLSLYSSLWILFLVYNTMLLIFITRKKTHLTIENYISKLGTIFVILVIQTVSLIMCDLLIAKEINTIAYIKFGVTLFVVSLFVSLVQFLEIGFYKYRIIWLLGFVGTVILAPLLVESAAFVRDLRLRSLLDFWNIIVPYEHIEQLRQFVLLEGWQNLEVVVGSALVLAAYWFIVASICLYVRQLQADWRYPHLARE